MPPPPPPPPHTLRASPGPTIGRPYPTQDELLDSYGCPRSGGEHLLLDFTCDLPCLERDQRFWTWCLWLSAAGLLGLVLGFLALVVWSEAKEFATIKSPAHPPHLPRPGEASPPTAEECEAVSPALQHDPEAQVALPGTQSPQAPQCTASSREMVRVGFGEMPSDPNPNQW